MAYKLSEIIVGGFVTVIRKVLSFFPLKVRYSFFENLGLLGYYLIKLLQMEIQYLKMRN